MTWTVWPLHVQLPEDYVTKEIHGRVRDAVAAISADPLGAPDFVRLGHGPDQRGRLQSEARRRPVGSATAREP